MLTETTFSDRDAMTTMTRLRATLMFLRQVDPFLTTVGLAMAAAALLAMVGLGIDHRVIGGSPAWLKPLKFGVSTAIYCLTLVWVFSYLPDWPGTRRWVSLITGIIILIEVAIIDLQAWRGTTSHFNVSTPVDAALFGIMGLGIITQTIASVFVAVALWRQSFADPLMGWALRWGMTVTIAGACIGGLMTRPTTDQLAEARLTHRLTISGAHTVGAPDGGPGLPGTGWSTDHGDLRVPHFLGLHALQALALVAVVVRRRRLPVGRGVRLIKAAAASYVTLVALFLWQALRGESIASPGAAMQLLVAAWLALTIGAVWASGFRGMTTTASAAA
jgi:hypothetical protein